MPFKESHDGYANTGKRLRGIVYGRGDGLRRGIGTPMVILGGRKQLHGHRIGKRRPGVGTE